MKTYQMTEKYMKAIYSGTVCLALLAGSGELYAQPFHTEVTPGGVQTLKVEGDVSIEQYGGGLGGDLKVAGDSHVAAWGVPLTGMPSGVTGTYYGTHKVGQSSNVGEYVFEKIGDNATGDFVVPLGMIGDWYGALVQLDVLVGTHDYDSGAAQFALASKRIARDGAVLAMEHSALGGGKGIKIRALNNGNLNLFLEYDADVAYDQADRYHKVIVRMSTIGTILPNQRMVALNETFPVKLINSIDSAYWAGDEWGMTYTSSIENTVFNGKVQMAAGAKVGGSLILTEATPPISSLAWTNAFVPRGAVSNDAMMAVDGTASGLYSIAVGDGTSATGDYSQAWGSYTTATGAFSYASGPNSAASGHYSRASGTAASASGMYSTAMGQNARATSNSETAFGRNNVVTVALNSVVWRETDGLFRIGNGLNAYAPSDALTVLKNGQTTLTNRHWKSNTVANPSSVLEDPPVEMDSGGNALIVDGHTILNGKVIISVPQGDISMGIYE